MTEELNGCIKCGNVGMESYLDSHTDDITGEWYIECPKCEFKSPKFKWESSAIRWWNGQVQS